MISVTKSVRPFWGRGAIFFLLFAGFACAQTPSSTLHDAAIGKLQPASIPVQITMTQGPRAAVSTTTMNKSMPFISPGTLVAAQEAINAADIRGEEAGLDAGLDQEFPDLGILPGSLGCRKRISKDEHRNVRVNQDCTLRRQAEESIAFNPADPDNLIAGQNDSRVGFNQCGIDWSIDNGEHWGDLLPPFRQKVNNPAGQEPRPSDPNRHTISGGLGTFHTYDVASDPDVAFDSQGRGFFSCAAFDVFTNASMLFVAESPLGAQGSFFFNIGTFSRNFVVVEDNNPEVFHDKPFITTDSYSYSPNRDNVYATWTVFRFSPDCGPQPNPGAEERYCESPIFGSMSTDHGRTWSTPEEISGVSPTLCFFGNFFSPALSANACNFDQGADPAVLPNGDLEVVFNNGNTSADNPNGQQLGVHCHPTGSSPAGTAHLNCGAPSKVGDDIVVGEPRCNFGRGLEECVPGAYIRTNDFPRIAVDRSNGHLYATWQDYRHGEYDIQLSQSTDGGFTWTFNFTVNPDRGLDHYFAAIDVARKHGNSEARDDRVGVSYYRTERVPNEDVTPPDGFAPCAIPLFANPAICYPGVGAKNSDYVLAGGSGLATPYNFKVVSPVFPPPDGGQTGFNGDYSGLIVKTVSDAHPIWSDTRNVDPYAPQNGVLHDEDIFSLNTGLPNGQADPSVGQIGEGARIAGRQRSNDRQSAFK